MDSTYFNEKYKEYLEEGHYGLAISNPDVVVFLEDMFDRVLTKVPDFKYSQIKLKFGKCRIYTNLNSPTLEHIMEMHINNLINKK